MTNNRCGANYGNRSIKELFVDLVVLIAGLGASGHWWPCGGRGGGLSKYNKYILYDSFGMYRETLGYGNTQTFLSKEKP